MQTVFRLLPEFLLLGLSACGGGSSSSPSSSPSVADSPAPSTSNDTGETPAAETPPSTAQVTVLLTDGPSHDWDQALATITSIELVGKNGTQTLFTGSETVDLLSLPDFYDVFAVADDINPDTFKIIRLYVEQLELIRLNDDGSVDESVLAQLVGGGQIDLKPHHSFYAGPGDSLFIEIDFDVHKTFRTTTTSDGETILRPVIKVNVTREEPVGRLTRLRGFLGKFDSESQRFTLCQSELFSTMESRDRDESQSEEDDKQSRDEEDDRGCVVVAVDELTGLFGADGMPVALDALEPEVAVTAVGNLRQTSERYRGDDEEDAEKTHDHHHHHKVHDYLLLQAVTVELGDDYKRVAGNADDSVNGDVFPLALTPGQNIGTDEQVLSVQIFDLTRIFSVDGTELDSTAIVAGVSVLADGVLVTSETEPDVLRAALLILDLDAGADEEALHGSIASVNFDAGTLQLLVDDTEICINANSADIFVISNVDGFSSARAGLGDLQPEQSADVFGSTEDELGCLLATDILASAAIANTLPIADAGEDSTVAAGESVMLDGSNSSDEDGDLLTYLWVLVSRPEGSSTELSAADTATPSFTTDAAGDYVIELVVNDGTEDSAPDSVTVTATMN